MLPTVRAKFRCTQVTPHTDNPEDGTNITLDPVIDGSEENKEFYKWTPSGQISLGTINEAAAKTFEVGKEYYVDFTPAS